MSRCANGRPAGQHSRACSPLSRVCPRRWPSTAASNCPPPVPGGGKVVRPNGAPPRWGKRLECARFLSVAAVPDDADRLLRLINDPHAAVHIAAVTCLERIESPKLTLAALDRLPRLA